jgi:hypothetical protein
MGGGVRVTIQTFPRESVEFLPVSIDVDGAAFDGGFEVCVKPYADRPSGWAAAVVVDDVRGVMLTGMTRGVYRVWARVSDVPETPVIDCGFIEIT